MQGMKDLLTPQAVEELLQAHGTRGALCELLDIDSTMLYRYLTGKRQMPMKVQIAIWAVCKQSRFLQRVRAGRAFTLDHLIREWQGS